MRLVALLLGVLLASVLVSLTLYQDNGYVLVSFGRWSVETSIVVFALILVALFAAAVAGWRLITGTFRMPERMFRWRSGRRRRQAREALTRGLIEMNEGHWRQAEKVLLKGVDKAETPLLNYLAAARAAQLQRADDRRDEYLRKAYESTPDAKVAVLITQAELQLDHQQYEQALATLTNLQELAPNNVFVLTLLMRTYRALRDWRQLRRLLPRLRKHDAAGDAELERLSVEVYRELIQSAVQRGDPAELESLWKDLPRSMTQRRELVHAYAGALKDVGEDAKAADFIERHLKRELDETLVRIYGQLETADYPARLARVEDWLQHHGQHPELLLAAARLSMGNQIWGKARQYLEASIQHGPRPEAYQELGRLLQRLGESDKGQAAFEAGLGLAVQERA